MMCNPKYVPYANSHKGQIKKKKKKKKAWEAQQQEKIVLCKLE